MAKKKKSTKPGTPSAVSSKKPFSVKRALFILITTIVAFTLYQTLNILEGNAGFTVPVTTTVFFAAAIILICLIIFFNRGFSTKAVTPEMLTEAGVAEENADKICRTLNRHKAIAKKLMLVLLPIVFTILLDMIYLFYGDFFAGAVKYIAGGGE